ncbi:chymotrypsin-1-like isoform X2 [Odontomachus brunneus]|nr:chymotrypsin-1-like isoform X2 [Odontomachus brunneus]
MGGNNAAPGQFKYQVSIQHGSRHGELYGQHICGGCLISEFHVVTAAHCVPEDKNTWRSMRVITGALWSINNDGESHEIKCISTHPNYTGDINTGLKHDIALITLVTPASTNNVQAPIRLASRDYATGQYRGIISGWGKTTMDSDMSPMLQWVQTNVLSQSECLQTYHPNTIPQQICTLEKAGTGACTGDSGGPLVVNGELCGVVSWTVPCAKGSPDVFTNLFYYRDFMIDSVNKCAHM